MNLKKSFFKGFSLYICLSVIFILFIGSYLNNNVQTAIATLYDSTNIFNDDFNDNVWTDKWLQNNVGTDFNITNENGYIKLDYNTLISGEGHIIGLSNKITDAINYNNATLQIDFSWVYDNGGNYAYFGLGAYNNWQENSIYVLISSDYGGLFKIYSHNATGDMNLYSKDSLGISGQLKIQTFPLNQSMSFYYNGIKYRNEKLGWFFTFYTYIEPCRVFFGIEYLSSKIGHSTIIFDNFVMYYNEIEASDYRTVRLKPSHLEYTDIIFPKPNVYGSVDKILTYPTNWNISLYCDTLNGFNVTNWIYENSTNTYNIYNNLGFFIPVDTITNISIIMNLLPNYHILDTIAKGLGINLKASYDTYVNIDFPYGILALENNTEITLYEIIDTVLSSYTFNKWEVDYNNNSIVEYISNYIFISITNNITVNVHSNRINQENTWFFRSADIVESIPPEPPLGGYYWRLMIDELYELNNNTDDMNYVSIHASYYYNTTTKQNTICNQPLYLASWETYPYRTINPLYDSRQGETSFSAEQLSEAVIYAKSKGFKILLIITSSPEADTYSIDYYNITDVRKFVYDYGQNVVIPLSIIAQSLGIDDYAISQEIQGVSNLADSITIDNPKGSFIVTSCNDLWNNIIYSVRQNFDGRVTQMLAVGYREIDFDVLKYGVYQFNLDYLIHDNWNQLDVASVFTSRELGYAWHSSYSFSNITKFEEDSSRFFDKKIVLNMGVPNRYGGEKNPWSDYGGYGSWWYTTNNNLQWRNDATQYNWWQGSIWALQGESWIGGIDFERYNQIYNYSDTVNDNLNEYNYITGFYSTNYYATSWRLNNLTREMIFNELSKMVLNIPPIPLTLSQINMTETPYNVTVGNNTYYFDFSHYPDSGTMMLDIHDKTYNFYADCYKNGIVFQTKLYVHMDINFTRKEFISDYGTPQNYSYAYANGTFILIRDELGNFWWNDGVYYANIPIAKIPDNIFYITYKLYDNNTYLGEKIISYNVYNIPSSIFTPFLGYTSFMDFVFRNIGIGIIILVPSFILMTIIHNPLGLFLMMNIITYINYSSGMWEITYFLFTMLLTIIILVIGFMGGLQ